LAAFGAPPLGSLEHELRPEPVIESVVSGFLLACSTLN
jgi:hypothetical protein